MTKKETDELKAVYELLDSGRIDAAKSKLEEILGIRKVVYLTIDDPEVA